MDYRQATLEQLKPLVVDPKWRLRNLYWIIDKSGNAVKFEPNWTQDDFLDAMHWCNIILKARQLGFTTLITLFMLDVCLWYDNVHAGIIADTDDKATEIFRDKVKFAYDNLAPGLKMARYTLVENVHTLELSNGSSIQVGTSMRGTTKQYLLVSELGKIAADSPAKAREIKTGAFNTVHAGQFLFVESTAKGREGLFYEMCEQAQDDARQKKPLTPLSFKFHFYAWFLDQSYALTPEQAAAVVISEADDKYFAKVEQEMDVDLTREQRAWYVEKRRTQKEDMKAEYPSTPAEAFEVSGEGRIYREEMAKARAEDRIQARIPVLPDVPVNMFFDIGGASNRLGADYMACWFCQRVATENRMIRFHRDSGRGIGWWTTYLKSHGYLLGKVYLPFDAKQKRLTMADAGKSVEDLFIDAGWAARDIVVVDRVENKWYDGIGQVRNIFPTLVFDESTCSSQGIDDPEHRAQAGIESLDNYKKVWNEQVGAWRDQPAHDEWSHGADAMETFARSEAAIHGHRPAQTTAKRKRARSWKTV